jgi:hypothetical protein
VLASGSSCCISAFGPATTSSPGETFFPGAGYATRRIDGEDIQIAFALYDQLWRSQPEDELDAESSVADGLTGPVLIGSPHNV